MRAWERALLEIGRAPGVLDVEALGRRLWPDPVRVSLPYGTSEARRREMEAREAHRKRVLRARADAKRRATNLCRELVRKDLVEPSTHYRLHAETAVLMRARGIDCLRSFVVDDDERYLRIQEGAALTGHARAIVEALLGAPRTARELRDVSDGWTVGGKPRGAWSRALDRLVDDGTVHTPAMRWLTAEGVRVAARLGNRRG